MKSPHDSEPTSRIRGSGSTPDALACRNAGARVLPARHRRAWRARSSAPGIARRWRGRWYGARIVETEAYLGVEDRRPTPGAAGARPRVEPMYADGGHLYVFLVYGMHHCANVVTRRAGVAGGRPAASGRGAGGRAAEAPLGPGQALRRARNHHRGQRARSARRRPGTVFRRARAAAADRRFARGSGWTTRATRRTGRSASSTWTPPARSLDPLAAQVVSRPERGRRLAPRERSAARRSGARSSDGSAARPPK